MADYKLAVIAGDGVGPEVITEGRKVLDAVSRSNPSVTFTFTEFPWGSDYYRETGGLMPDDGIEQLAGHDVILCCETLEHIPWIEAGQTLSRFAASAVPWLIVSVPYQGFQFGFSLYLNRYLWRRQTFFKKFRFLSEFPAPEDDDWEPHKWEIGYRGYSVARLRDMVTGAGYQIVRQDFTSGCRSIFLVARNARAAGS